MSNSDLDSSGQVENEKTIETGREAGNRETASEREALDITGAEMLEEPADGSFVSALHTFVAWVKTVLADDDKK